MSQQAAVAFMVSVRDDLELQARLRRLAPIDMDDLLQVASELGYPPFSREDCFAAARIVGGEWLIWAAVMREGRDSAERADADLDRIDHPNRSGDTWRTDAHPASGAPD